MGQKNPQRRQTGGYFTQLEELEKEGGLTSYTEYKGGRGASGRGRRDGAGNAAQAFQGLSDEDREWMRRQVLLDRALQMPVPYKPTFDITDPMGDWAQHMYYRKFLNPEADERYRQQVAARVRDILSE